jgi:hypothetical protein
MRRVSAYGTTFSVLSNNLPDRNGEFIVAEDGRKFRKSPLLSKWGDIAGQ